MQTKNKKSLAKGTKRLIASVLSAALVITSISTGGFNSSKIAKAAVAVTVKAGDDEISNGATTKETTITFTVGDGNAIVIADDKPDEESGWGDASVTATVTLTDSDDGVQKEIKYFVKPSDGDVEEGSFTVTYDKTAPVISGVSVAGDAAHTIDSGVAADDDSTGTYHRVIDDATTGTSTFTLTASEDDVTYTVTDSANGTTQLSGTFTVTGKGVHTIQIAPTDAAGNVGEAKSITITNWVKDASIPAPTLANPVEVGGDTGIAYDGNVVDASDFSLDRSSLANKAGTASVVFKKSDDDTDIEAPENVGSYKVIYTLGTDESNYALAVSSAAIPFKIVKKAETKGKVTGITGSISYGANNNEYTLVHDGASAGGTTTFTSSDTSVISISNSTATVLKAGTANITATTETDNGIETSSTLAVTVSVGTNPLTVESINVNNTTRKMTITGSGVGDYEYTTDGGSNWTAVSITDTDTKAVAVDIPNLAIEAASIKARAAAVTDKYEVGTEKASETNITILKETLSAENVEKYFKLKGTEFTYSGVDQASALKSEVELTTDYSSSGITPTVTLKQSTTEVTEAKNAGKYDVYVAIEDGHGGSYLDVSTAVKLGEVTIGKKKPTITVPSSPVTGTYGNTTSLTLGSVTEDNNDTDGVVSYTSSDASIVAVDSETGALTVNKAGSVTITVSIAETDNYLAADDKTITVTISGKNISGATITVSGTYTYDDGNAITPTYTVKDGDTDLVKDVDYTESFSSNNNAGTGVITITGIGNYSGSKTENFTIGKKVVEQSVEEQTTILADADTINGKTVSAKISDFTNSGKYGSPVADQVITSGGGIITGTAQGTGSSDMNFDSIITSATLRTTGALELVFAASVAEKIAEGDVARVSFTRFETGNYTVVLNVDVKFTKNADATVEIVDSTPTYVYSGTAIKNPAVKVNGVETAAGLTYKYYAAEADAQAFLTNDTEGSPIASPKDAGTYYMAVKYSQNGITGAIVSPVSVVIDKFGITYTIPNTSITTNDEYTLPTESEIKALASASGDIPSEYATSVTVTGIGLEQAGQAVSISASDKLSAGTYDIVASVTSNISSYEITVNKGTLTVSAAATPEPASTPAPGSSSSGGGSSSGTPAATATPAPTASANPDGSTTTKTETTNADGSKTTTETTTQKDGSKEEVVTTTSADGTSTKTTTTETDKDGKVTSTTVASETDTLSKSADGTGTKSSSTETTAADGSKTASSDSTTVTKTESGSETTTTTVKNSEKSTTSASGQKTVTESEKTTTVVKDSAAQTETTITSEVVKNGQTTTSSSTETVDKSAGTTTKASTVEVKDATGALVEKVETTSSTAKNGTVKETEITTQVDGSQTIEASTTKSNGDATINTVEKNASGKVVTTKSTITVPSSVTSAEGIKYTVTEIDKNAYKGEKSIKKVTIPKSVKKIGANAFKGDSKLKTITIKGNTTIAKGAFSGISKTATIKITGVTKKQYNKMVKQIKKSSLGKKVKIKKA